MHCSDYLVDTTLVPVVEEEQHTDLDGRHLQRVGVLLLLLLRLAAESAVATHNERVFPCECVAGELSAGLRENQF